MWFTLALKPFIVCGARWQGTTNKNDFILFFVLGQDKVYYFVAKYCFFCGIATFLYGLLLLVIKSCIVEILFIY